ncbi:hypothetical protein ACEE45_01645 [Proteus vulgaris]|uniref:hypothetical protein n=1 Tax=Proteus TaxID=583 RepID=UPI0005010A26|nr:hypothetical protein [Proteus vulgaris]KGA59495.1 hypothetical protein DR95_1317 [Proteus vulgaris]
MSIEIKKLLLATNDIANRLEEVAEEYQIKGSELSVIAILKAVYEENRPTGLQSTDA